MVLATDLECDLRRYEMAAPSGGRLTGERRLPRPVLRVLTREDCFIHRTDAVTAITLLTLGP